MVPQVRPSWNNQTLNLRIARNHCIKISCPYTRTRIKQVASWRFQPLWKIMKNMSQNGNLPQIGLKNKKYVKPLCLVHNTRAIRAKCINIWNHHLDGRCGYFVFYSCSMSHLARQAAFKLAGTTPCQGKNADGTRLLGPKNCRGGLKYPPVS